MNIFKRKIRSEHTDHTKKIIDPIELFKSLVHQEGYDYLRDIQNEFLQTWHQKRDLKDIVGILNTGAGKTLVGQLMLLSKLHEEDGPVVYLCPDNQLVEQAVSQAKIHNIPVVTITQDRSRRAEFPLEFKNNQAILITTFERMFNGLSIFGVEGFGSRPIQEIGSLVIDDAHSCIKKARKQCTIQIDNNSQAYQKIFDLFEDALKEQGPGALTAIKSGERSVTRLIPYWKWQQQIDSVSAILEELYSDDSSEVRYSWGLIADELLNSQCFISGRKIEITPLQLPVHKIPSFFQAKHRFILSATFNNDTELIKELGIEKNAVEHPIEVQNQGDTGERLIIAPKRHFPDLNDDFMRSEIFNYSRDNNVVVIVPDSAKAEEWKKYNPIIVNKNNILQATEQLKQTKGNLMVFLNRYDGIDLAGDACRILVLDGLPRSQSVREQYMTMVREGSPFVNAQIAQTIEQGLGRAVRSGSDYCSIFILDSQLLNFLGIDKNREFFTSSTKKQIDFGLELFDEESLESIDSTMEEIRSAVDACLKRDSEWRQFHKEMMLQAINESESKSETDLLEIAETERQALEAYKKRNYIEASSMMSRMISEYSGRLNDNDKAWYMQIGAHILNEVDQTKAADMQVKAKELSSRALIPQVNTYSKKTKTKGNQAEILYRWKNAYSNSNDIKIAIDDLIDNLIYSPNLDHNKFEDNVHKLGEFLGFASQRPEYDYGDGPDNLWRFENGDNIIIEAKNNGTNEKVSREHIAQLLHSIQWHKDKYGELNFTPIILHKSSISFENSHPPENTKVMDQESLNRFKQALNNLATSFSQKKPESWTVEEIRQLLSENKLNHENILGAYTRRLR
ncbi:DEAD/DEAH box helicase [Marinococcus halophilus]|uniref:DEAD/DEAH box helicase n=1 Tax=Marinococcus halophilus TaxID=1371 RepID=UPI0009A725A2|nr:DEAD/DEAH box helicase [Marinococcus halophilus]